MAEKVKSINLLPEKGEGIVSQFLSWALTVGRLLIILTETLALGTFLYRFSLDMKISDFHDQIKNQSSITSQFRTTEEASRNLQDRLALAKRYDSASSITPTAFSDIVNMGKGIITFNEILVSTSNAKIEVQASNSNALRFFVSKLKNYTGFKSVNIDTIENQTSNAIIKMTISAQLKDSAI